MTSNHTVSVSQVPSHRTRAVSQYIDALLSIMLRTITATICLHPIRSAAELPHTRMGINFNVPFCGECSKSRAIAAEHEAAYIEHKRLEEMQEQDPDRDRQELREARVRYSKAHFAYLADQELRTQRHRNDHSVPPQEVATASPTALDSILRDESTPRARKDLTVHFDETDDYRPEEEYRSQSSFDRTADHYKPGLHADDSGNGFFNTSDPYLSDTSSELSDLSSEKTDEEPSDEKREDSGNEEDKQSSDEEMGDLSDDAQDEGNVDEAAREPSGDHATGDDEEDGSDQSDAEREEMMEKARVLQERIDELCKKYAQ